MKRGYTPRQRAWLAAPLRGKIDERVGHPLDPTFSPRSALRETDVPALNKLLLDNGIGLIDAGKKVP